MDTNKENELLEEVCEDLVDNTETEDVTEDTIIEETDIEQTETNEEYEQEDLFEDFEEITEDDYLSESEKKKTGILQKPIIISIVAFLLTAVIVLGTVFVYDLIVGKEEKFTIEGVWLPADNADSGVYYIFEEDGKFSVNIGGQLLEGSYLLEEVENTEGESEEEETYLVLTPTPNVFSSYETYAVVTFDEESETVTLNFTYSSPINLVKAELPEFKINGSDVTHASADELGIDTFVGDEEIVGSWVLEEYTGDVVYTFNADGTGSLVQEYETDGYTISLFFKYIVSDGKIFVTIELYSGTTSDGEMNYYMDKGKMIINDIAFEKMN